MKVSNFTLDWLSFTFKPVSVDDQVSMSQGVPLIDLFFKYFPELEYQKENFVIIHGRNYAHGMCLDDDITIRFDDDDFVKGVNVEIPSHGLRHFFQLLSSSEELPSVRDIFKILSDRYCKPSRIDICFDDYTKRFSPSYFYRMYKNYIDFNFFKENGYYKKVRSDGKEIKCRKCPSGIALITKMRTGRMQHSSDGKGETFYIGDRRKRMLRIYDKEYESEGEINAIRYEFELHSDYAFRIFRHIIESEDSEVVVFGDYFNSVFDLRYINENNFNVPDWEKVEDWIQFLKSTLLQRNINVPKYPLSQEILKIENYIEVNNYSSFYYMIARHGLKSVLRAVKEHGISPRYKALLNKVELQEGLERDSLVSNCLINF